MRADPDSRSWRRFARFSVRGLIVFVIVIGGGLGWLVRSARIQREAVAAITAARGSVKYDWEESNGAVIAAGKPWAPGWLVNRIGVDYFGHVTSAALPGPTDATFAQVGRLTQVQTLIFDASDVSNAG
jgi:hypothetical protein